MKKHEYRKDGVILKNPSLIHDELKLTNEYVTYLAEELDKLIQYTESLASNINEHIKSDKKAKGANKFDEYSEHIVNESEEIEESIKVEPSGSNLHQLQRSIYNLISNNMVDTTSSITCGVAVGSSLSDLSEFNVTQRDSTVVDINKLYPIGNLNINDKTIIVNIDPNMKYDDLRIFIDNLILTLDINPTFII